MNVGAFDAVNHAAPGEQMQERIDLASAATASRGSTSNAMLELKGVSKTFGSTCALRNVDLDLNGGEVHVLFGENGAGKSTLIRIITGALPPDEGAVFIGGQLAADADVRSRRRLGISAVFQEFSLAPHLTVEENLLLGKEESRWGFLDKPKMRQAAMAILADLAFELDLSARVCDLSRAEQQMVEIAKAISTDPKIIIFDEPTASLTSEEAKKLYAIIARLKKAGVGIIYITHRMAEIFQLGDRITIMRDGEKICTLPVEGLNDDRLVELMTGRKVGKIFPTIVFQPGETALAVKNLSTMDGRVAAVDLSVSLGEIVGLAGLVGCGKSEIGRACYGLEKISPDSRIEILGEAFGRITPREMIKRGVHYLPSDRRREGLLLERSALENISLSMLFSRKITQFGLIQKPTERSRVESVAKAMGVKPFNIDANANFFSGGNQQKIILARIASNDIRLLILDEPTVGIDIGAKAEIYKFLEQVTKAGAGVLLISSDLPEILHLSNRVYVIRNGSVGAHLAGDDITESRVLGGFFGVH